MTLRILSYNILEGGQDRLPTIARVIQQQNPDVVALLEANDPANVQMLAGHLNMQVRLGKANGSKDHVAWLSRLPILDSTNHSLPGRSRTLLEITIDQAGGPLTLFATHLTARQVARREQQRVEEMHAILTHLRRQKDAPHALMGDLNTIHPDDQPDLPTYLTLLRKKDKHFEPQFPRQVIPLLLKDGYTDCYRTIHPATPGYTLDTAYPSVRFDYIFASPTLAQRLQDCDVITTEDAQHASDHFPLQATFR